MSIYISVNFFVWKYVEKNHLVCPDFQDIHVNINFRSFLCVEVRWKKSSGLSGFSDTGPQYLEWQEYLNSWNDYFWLKNDVKKWSRIFYFEIERDPSELLLSSVKKRPRKAELAWQVSRYLWRGSVDFKKF